MPQIRDFAHTRELLRKYESRAARPGSYSLENMRQLMNKLGNPQDSFKVIHVAGTSGKTSTVYYLSALLQAAGQTVGLTVSPHVDEVNERVQINLKPLPEKSFCQELGNFIDLVKQTSIKPTYFELLVAFAYWIFAKQKVDYAVVEVGLGARFDATNVLPAPEAALITNISLEHTRYLGKTVESIAWEKSHIIKPGTICVTGTSGDALKIVRTACARAGAKLHVTTSCAPSVWKKFHPSLTGDFQKMNLALVLKTIEVLKGRGWKIPLRAVLEGSSGNLSGRPRSFWTALTTPEPWTL